MLGTDRNWVKREPSAHAYVSRGSRNSCGLYVWRQGSLSALGVRRSAQLPVVCSLCSRVLGACELYLFSFPSCVLYLLDCLDLHNCWVLLEVVGVVAPSDLLAHHPLELQWVTLGSAGIWMVSRAECHSFV
jgi:hypothetical protein